MREWYARIVLFLIRPALERRDAAERAAERKAASRKAIMAHVEAQQKQLVERLKRHGVVR